MQASTNNPMETETASRTDFAAESGKGVVQAMEEGWGALGQGTWHLFHALPGHGTVPGFAVGLGAAMLVGVWRVGSGVLHIVCQLQILRLWRIVERGD